MDFSLIAAGWISLETIQSLALVVIGLGFVIFVHELGHFLAAKMCGVKCEKFYVGFDFFDVKIGDRVIIPKSLVKWVWGETEYGIGSIPLGGYVKMLGQEDNPGEIAEENLRDTQGGGAAQAGPVDRERIDPRSYRAKSVLQRMWIISAGVIFNIIFAVIFAAAAFRMGVNYEPATVGQTLIGSVAWEENLDGATFLRINDRRFDQGYAPFTDIVQEIVLSGAGGEVEIEYLPVGESASKTLRVKPRPREVMGGLSLPMVGVQPENSVRLGKGKPTLTGQAADRADLRGGDLITHVDGQPIKQFSELKRHLTHHFDQTVELTVQRAGDPQSRRGQTETAQVMLEPNPIRELGFDLEIGPIVALRKNSPAAQAGLAVGDRLVALNGQPLGNPLTLDQRLIKLHRDGQQSIEVTVSRKVDGQLQELTIAVPLRLPSVDGSYDEGMYSFETLGVACRILPTVAGLDPGSAVARAGVAVGDRLKEFRFELPESFLDSPDLQTYRKRNSGSVIDPSGFASADQATRGAATGLLGPSPSDVTPIEFARRLLQQLPVGTKFQLIFVKPSGEKIECDAVSTLSATDFQTTRGMAMTLLSKVYNSPSWTEALALGFKQVRSDLTMILKSLQRLATGQISPKAIGGIGTIGAAATAEAGQGFSRLLLFLTMLSANLAIINLLPIPVLDGGHLMFLAYEGIFRRPVTERVQVALSWMGLILLLGLMSFAIFMDITRFIEWLR